MKRIVFIFIIICISAHSYASSYFTDTISISRDSINYKIFYSPDGKKASEGYLEEGKPNGYWKTYYPNGIIKSEGNRLQFLLDSVWKFYNETGEITLFVNYKKGKKNGIRNTQSKEGLVEETFINDIKQGIEKHYFPNGSIKKTINFIDGKAEGISKEYYDNGRISAFITYKKGYISSKEFINRLDRENKKHGPWKEFHDNGFIKWECNYQHGDIHGYYKEYSKSNSLINIYKYENGVLLNNVDELEKPEIKREYYSNGTIKTEATYHKGVAEGIRRNFDQKGEIVSATIYKTGKIVAEGITDLKGQREGLWEEYYLSNNEEQTIKSTGNYKGGKKTGKWVYYYRNGQIEQQGSYSKYYQETGLWKWYYETGQLLRKEYYINGKKDGGVIELNEDGDTITRGSYFNGLEDGEWLIQTGDMRLIGSYSEGKREGYWKHYYIANNISQQDSIQEIKNTLIYKGNYIYGEPDGEHISYWNNGNTQTIGTYIMGEKTGEWITNNRDNSPLLNIYFEDGKEIKYNGIRIKPALD